MFPRRLIVLLPVALIKRRDILNRPLHGPAGLGIVGDGAVELLSGGCAFDAVFPFLAVKAHTGEAAVVGEHDAAVGVVPGVGLVLLEHRELDAVDGFQLIQGHAQGHGGEHVNLHQRLAAFVVGAQGGVPGPGVGQGGEAGWAETEVLLGLAVIVEGVDETLPPEDGIIVGKAVEEESASNYRWCFFSYFNWKSAYYTHTA